MRVYSLVYELDCVDDTDKTGLFLYFLTFPPKPTYPIHA